MRAILIDPDPAALNIIEIELSPRPGQVIAAVERAIGAAAPTPVSLGRGHQLWYDLLFLAKRPRRFIVHRDVPHAVAGRCLILGETWGASPATLNVTEVRHDLVHLLRIRGRLYPVDPEHPDGIDPSTSMAVPTGG